MTATRGAEADKDETLAFHGPREGSSPLESTYEMVKTAITGFFRASNERLSTRQSLKAMGDNARSTASASRSGS
jgi:hypothetical protein